MPHPPATPAAVTDQPRSSTIPSAVAHELVGTITFADLPKHQIGLKHDGIPEQLLAGTHRFDVAPDAAVPVDEPWPGAPVGQEVVCVLKTRKGQWVVTKIMTRQHRPAPNRSDGEDAAVQEVLTSLKSQDKAVRERGLTTVIQNAKNWKPATCTAVAKVLASVNDDKFTVSRALCEIIARVDPGNLAEGDGRTTQRAALDSLQIVNPALHQLVMEFLTIKFASRGRVASKLVRLGQDGKAATPLLQEYILRTVGKLGWRKTAFSVCGQEFEGCVRALMAMAPEEPSTLDAIIELLRCYADWSKKGNHTEDFELRYVVYFMEQLGTFGTKAKRATPILEDLKCDEKDNVKRTADRTLRQVTQN